MSQKWDIGIAPLINDEFNRGKSHIKWMEYAMCGIPCVASDVAPYKVIRNGIDGILTDDDHWYYNLRRLVRDRNLRAAIGYNALLTVGDFHQYGDHAHLWTEALSNFI
jgi:glycosyltransferase involved in cell wall biosynthesis